jgi:protein transport protein SEC31
MLMQGSTNSNFQSGPPGPGSFGSISSQPGVIPGQRMPQVVAPTPTRGFMPLSSPGTVAQSPGMVSTQPSSPTQPASAQPAVVPQAPPATVQTADTSSVPGNLNPPPSLSRCI